MDIKGRYYHETDRLYIEIAPELSAKIRDSQRPQHSFGPNVIGSASTTRRLDPRSTPAPIAIGSPTHLWRAEAVTSLPGRRSANPAFSCELNRDRINS